MKRRALVIGSPGSTGLSGALLQGVEHDTGAMTAMLARRGFDVDVCVGPAATRDGILAGYDRLIAGCTEGDAAAIYYSGHGFYTLSAQEAGRPLHGIVPVDLDGSTDHDFRGITAWELSIKQAQLTARTQNVTVILDCCHSSQMSRTGAVHAAQPRALPHPLRLGFAAHQAALRAKYGAACDAVDPAGSPHAVRLVACGLTESAYEYADDTGTCRGAFTEALLGVLREVGDAELSWAALGDAIRERVLRRFPYQRPDLEGPTRRRLFSVARDEDGGAVRIEATARGFRIGAGRLLGVQPGDRYGVMPLGAAAYDPERAIAELEIEQVSALFAEAKLRAWHNGRAALPADAIAFPVLRQAILRPVELDAPAAARPMIEDALAATRTLRPAASGEEPLARLRVADHAVTIEDRIGPLFPPVRIEDQLSLAIKNVANLGAAQGLRELIGEHGVHRSEVEIEWGVVSGGEPRRMPESGGSIGLRDRIYVKLRSRAQRQLFAHVFNIGLRGKITLLTRFAPSGVPLRYGEDHVLGQRHDGTLLGIGVGWPPEMPTATFPRVDELIVIVSTTQVSLQGLETTEHLAAKRGGGTKLQELLAQLQDGLARNVTRDVGSAYEVEDYLIKQLSFLLHPRDAVMADIPFEVDEDPLRQAGARAAAAWIARGRGAEPAPPRPQTIAIRLADLVVENNRALGKADIRVDALICTRGASEAQSHIAWTQKCQRVRDGERLALDNALLFHGPACDFVDICLWVSRDTDGSLELARLFAERATSAELRDAAGALLLGAGATALVPWVTAVGASAVLARIAYELLLGVTGKSIGLYRTSFLAQERFGAGRHPATGLHRAQDFSFSLVIDEIDAPAPA
jgi:hypothetical protein